MDSPLIEETVDATLASGTSAAGLTAYFGWRQAWHIGLMLIALVSAGTNRFHWNSAVPHDPSVPVLPASQMQTAIVTTEAFIPEYEFPGTVTANEKTTIYAESSGRIVELLAKDGDLVETEQVLLRLSNLDLVRQLDEAKSAVATANREMERLRLRINQARAESQVALLQARNAHDDALRTFASDDELFKLGFISRQKLRLSRQREERLRLSFEALVQRESTTDKSDQLHLEERQTQLQLTEQRRAQFQTEVDALTVTSKTTGKLDLSIQRDSLEVGKQLSAWTVVGHVYQPSTLRVQFEIDDAQAVEVDVDQVAVLKIEGQFPTRIKSRLKITGQNDIFADLPMPLALQLHPGQPVQGILQGRVRTAANFLPRSAVDVKLQARQTVFRVENGQATRTPVTWGASNARGFCVLDGLAAGDVIITTDVSDQVGDAPSFRIASDR